MSSAAASPASPPRREAVALVLRGRPGLGHVTPGLAIARGLAQAGHRVKVLTYGAGADFLERSPLVDWDRVEVDAAYSDWPGLALYPHGVRQVMPALEAMEASALVLGGEYFLTPVGRVMDLPTALVFNPATFRKQTHGAWFRRTLRYLLDQCSVLLPMSPGPAEPDPFAGTGVVVPGPFVLAPESPTCEPGLPNGGVTVLIANGGGCEFPANTRSYAADEAARDLWTATTRRMTRAAVAAALRYTGPDDRIFLFSCLPDAETRTIVREAGGEDRVVLSQPSSAYYDVLARAGVIVSRIGAGFLADASTSHAHVVAWPLPGHVEHEQLARQARNGGAGMHVCDSPGALDAQVGASLARARAGGAPPRRQRDRTEAAVAAILASAARARESR